MQKTSILFSVSMIFPLLLSFNVFSQSSDSIKAIDLSLLSFEEFLNAKVSVATKYVLPETNAPSIITVITHEEIENMGARNIIDVLQTIPGIDITHSIIVPDFQINSRGIYAFQQNIKYKFLLNDHVLNVKEGNPYFLFSQLPIDGIERIEVIRGPGSALYGTDAFLGVIKITTAHSSTNNLETKLELGNFNYVKPSLDLNYNKNNFKMSLYSDYFKTEGYHANLAEDASQIYPQIIPSKSRDITSDQHSFKLFSNIQYSDFNFTGYIQNFSGNIPIGGAAVLTDENEMKYRYYFCELAYSKRIIENLVLDIRTYYDRGIQNNLYELYPEETAQTFPDFPDEEGMYGSPRQKQNVVGSELTIDYELNKNIRLVGGLLYDYLSVFDVEHYANYNVTSETIQIDGILYPPGIENRRYFHTGLTNISDEGNWKQPANRTIIATYLQSTFNIKDLLRFNKIGNSLALTVGLRNDSYSDIGSHTNYRFGLVYAPFQRIYTKALYGEAMRAPNFQEMYTINNPIVEGNENLRPETVKTLEWLIGGYPIENLKINLTYFNLKINGLIDIENYMWVNKGRLTSQGIEVDMKYILRHTGYFWMNFTYQHVENTTREVIRSNSGDIYIQDDYFPGNTPSFLANLGMNYSFSSNMSTNISLNYTGERKRTEQLKWDEDLLVRVDKRPTTPDRLLFNMSLQFLHSNKRVGLRLSGYNLFNANYKSPDPSVRLNNDMPMEGRSFMLSVTHKLNNW